MNYWEQLAAGSERHKAERRGKTLQVSVVKSGDPLSLEAFKPVALEVLRRDGEDGYEVIHKHPVSGGFYDLIVIRVPE
jgi:hypothetical protein